MSEVTPLCHLDAESMWNVRVLDNVSDAILPIQRIALLTNIEALSMRLHLPYVDLGGLQPLTNLSHLRLQWPVEDEDEEQAIRRVDGLEKLRSLRGSVENR